MEYRILQFNLPIVSVEQAEGAMKLLTDEGFSLVDIQISQNNVWLMTFARHKPISPDQMQDAVQTITGRFVNHMRQHGVDVEIMDSGGEKTPESNDPMRN